VAFPPLDRTLSSPLTSRSVTRAPAALMTASMSRGAICRPLSHTGGFCISPQKGAASSFYSRKDETAGLSLNHCVKNGVSQSTLCDTPGMPCRKSLLKTPISGHLRGFETPTTWPSLLLHLFGGLCRNLYWARTCCTRIGAAAAQRPLKGYLSADSHQPLGRQASRRLLVHHVLAPYRLCRNPHTCASSLIERAPAGGPPRQGLRGYVLL